MNNRWNNNGQGGGQDQDQGHNRNDRLNEGREIATEDYKDQRGSDDVRNTFRPPSDPDNSDNSDNRGRR